MNIPAAIAKELNLPPDIHLQTRKIRNIEVGKSDLLPLILGKKKIPSTPINAYGALLQECEGGTSDFIIFSSWLPALIGGWAKEGPANGTIKEHIEVACPTNSDISFFLVDRWIFSLCGGKPLHWVLGWVDFASKEYAIFDGLPELNSSAWAIPLLIQTVNYIHTYLKRDEIRFKKDPAWKSRVYGPPPLQRQIDDWSCGLYDLMAMRACAAGEDFMNVTDEKKDEMRLKVLEALLTLPIHRVTNPTVDTDEDDWTITHYNGIPVEEIHNKKDHNSNDSPKTNPLDDETPLDGNPDACGKAETTGEQSRMKRKQSQNKEDEESPDSAYDTETEQFDKKRKLSSSGTRAPRTDAWRRKQELENDEWISEVEEKRVKCKGCREWRTLNKSYNKGDWDKHKQICPQITGIERKRVATTIKGPTTAPKGVPSITRFLIQNSSQPTTNSTDHPTRSSNPVSSATTYTIRTTKVTPSIASIFGPKVEREQVQRPTPTPVCIHLSGPAYEEYILRIRTRSLGGVSPEFRARAMRQLFPYKKFPPLEKDPKQKNLDGAVFVETPGQFQGSKSIPANGNDKLKEALWTKAEKRALDKAMLGWARWEVDYVNGFVRSTRCEGTTSNGDKICDKCKEVSKDKSLKRAIRRKNAEGNLSQEEQHTVLMARAKFAPKTSLGTDTRQLGDKLRDPLVFQVFLSLEEDDHTKCFLSLYQAAREGRLNNSRTFTELCQVFEDRLVREASSNKNSKFGIRYPRNYLNFMILMRSRGGSTGKQYEIFKSQLGGPSPRHIRSLVANSKDALQNPALVYENMARVKRLVDAVKFKGPLATASDCTKVKKRLSYSNDFGSHVLGSVLPLEECEVDEGEEIDQVIKEIKKKNAMASQTRAIIIKIPLPEIPPIVVALIPGNGKDSAEDIHSLHLQLLRMAERLDLKIITFSADGASAELLAQELMDQEQSALPPLTYDYPLYGVYLKCPVRATGPTISPSDPPHLQKTFRNQKQYGTHTASMGAGHIVNASLVALYDTGVAGLVLKDVENVDKQDDGAARRVFHTVALDATTTADNGIHKIRNNFHGLFVYIFFLGTLIDAWLSRTMSIRDRMLCAFRARFFLHIWREHIISMSRQYKDLYSMARSFISNACFHITNRVCDTLVLLALAYTEYYPDQPFCPWLLGTEFVEHFFGLARMTLPNFTYPELLKMVQHIMVRQRILLSGDFNTKREKESGVGYILDYDAAPLTPEDFRLALPRLTRSDLNGIVELAFNEANSICKDILKISVSAPSIEKPVPLVKCGAPRPKPKKKKTASSKGNDDEDSDAFEEDEESDSDDNNNLSDDDNSSFETTLGEATKLAAKGASRMSALEDDYDDAVEDASHAGPIQPISLPSIPRNTGPTLSDKVTPKSEIFGADGKVSVTLMLALRRRLQYGTKIHSEKVVRLDPKYALRKTTDITDPDEKKKMSIKEAAQRVRVGQDLADDLEKDKKAREIRWQTVSRNLSNVVSAQAVPNIQSRNVNGLFYLKQGSYLIIRNEAKRIYIGEVLDLYKLAAGNRYGSVKRANGVEELKYLSVRVYLPLIAQQSVESDVSDDNGMSDVEDEAPRFSCRHKSRATELHTHAKSEDVLYHIGWEAFISGGSHSKELNSLAAKHWIELNKPAAKAKLAKIKIPGGKKTN